MFFDLQALKKQAKDDPRIMVIMLRNYYEGKIPKNYRGAKYHSKVSLKGDAYLENPKRFFDYPTTYEYKVQYLILISKRDYLMMKTYGIRYLDRSYFPDLNTDALRGNPLVTVTEKTINFNI